MLESSLNFAIGVKIHMNIYFYPVILYVYFHLSNIANMVVVRAPKRNVPDERISVSQTVKAKAMDALKVRHFYSQKVKKSDYCFFSFFLSLIHHPLRT